MDGYRQQLRGVVAASAAPYGYTLTLWTAGAITSHAEQAFPSMIDTLLLLIGAVVGFGIIGAVACRGVNGTLPGNARGGMRIWGGIHLPSVGASILLIGLLTHLVHGHAVWPVVGFTATATYLLVIAGQFWLAARAAGDEVAAAGQ